MKTYPYQTLDVFTREAFRGNPLAVVRGADDLETASMQQIAAEFNYSETTFVLPPADPTNDACIRIFTPTEEMPFAGHPNVGTAWALALERRGERPEVLRFEEKAGLVEVRLSWNLDTLESARVAAPLPLEVGSAPAPGGVAECLGCAPGRIVTRVHPPTCASVGAAFVFVELAPGTLPALQPSAEAFARFGAEGVGLGIFAYEQSGAGPDVLEARMFWPAGGVREDPATGSASAALAGLLASLAPDRRRTIEIWQGRTMGRLSRIAAGAGPEGALIRAWVAGECVPVMEGRLRR